MNRFSAFAIHLLISLAVFGAFMILLLYWWYPDFFFQSDGGGQGVRIVFLVDVVLGPVLTLVVFDTKKPELKRDLAMIGTLQMVCLAAGMYIVWSERPLALVYTDGLFYSVSADDYDEPPDLSHLPGPYPKRVAIDMPADPVAQSELRSTAWRAGTPLRVLVERYIPDPGLEPKLPDAFPTGLIVQRDTTGEVPRWLAEYGGVIEDYAFFPFGARYGFAFLGYRRESGELLGMLDVSAVDIDAE